MQKVDIDLTTEASGGQTETIANAAKLIEQDIALRLDTQWHAKSILDMSWSPSPYPSLKEWVTSQAARFGNWRNSAWSLSTRPPRN